MKKKFSIVDCAIAIVFVLVLSFYVLPQGIGLLLNEKDKVSYSIKEKILLAGKTYLENNTKSTSVSLKVLYDMGYLQHDDSYYKNCFSSISMVSKDKDSYNLNLKCVNDDSTLTLLQ